ncbi:C45 family peptidase [Halobacteriovorax sp. JY17]|uniref:C45 family autoproteolytic acyltransferase/hydolase n=1 Tax=Halobacteriovorax sp. JY17 TaxID=2014617 RepID=UPI000C5F9CBB|nr:C45 family peptidase [Halobacteriovorax sp. JY17]PIK13703.1 MAG: hypothetical protein CES88_16060 [Halobacteriovorax sp. JY17]
MKYLLMLILLLSKNIYAYECSLEKESKGNTLKTCSIKGKKVKFLSVDGTMEDLAYYHGLFMPEDVTKGVLASVQQRRDESLAALSSKDRRQFSIIYQCMMSKYRKSVSIEFLKELNALARGVRDGGFSLEGKDVVEATLMIEMSGFVDSLNLEMEQDKRGANWELIKGCGFRLASGAIKNVFRSVGKTFKKMKKGCTGFTAPSSISSNGSHLHGRNFDTGFLGVFEKYPVIIHHKNSEGVNYMGMSSAGLHYPGGISGMNEYGISISTHELRTKNYKVKYKDRVGVVAPYAANYILSRAKTLDEAISIGKSFGYFGAWSFLISDSKSGESVSLEISGDVVRVAKRDSAHGMGQSNHFLHPDTSRDNYEYSINKSLESRARLSLVESELEKSSGSIDIQWGIDLLSGHNDFLMGKRSFGRTISKVYTSMTHIMDTKNHIFWFSLGESYPTNLSTFLGLKIDYSKAGDFFQFAGESSNSILEDSSWKNSLELYTQAYLAYDHERDRKKKLVNTYRLLTRANILSLEDHHFEFPYELMRVRVGLKLLSEFPSEVDSFEILEGLNTLLLNIESLHDYEKSQVYEDLAKFYDLTGQRKRASENFRKSISYLEELRESFLGHHYLNKLYWTNFWFIENTYSKYDNFREELHFATVE